MIHRQKGGNFPLKFGVGLPEFEFCYGLGAALQVPDLFSQLFATKLGIEVGQVQEGQDQKKKPYVEPFHPLPSCTHRLSSRSTFFLLTFPELRKSGPLQKRREVVQASPENKLKALD